MVLERSFVCSPRLHLFDKKYNKKSNVVKYYYSLKYFFPILIHFKIEFIPVVTKLNLEL